MNRQRLFTGSLKTWLIGGLLLGTMAYAIAEDITLTTYYPSPKGVYKDLLVTGKMGIGTTDPQTALHLGGLGGTLLSEAPATLLMGDTRSGPISSIPIWTVGNSGDRFYVDRSAYLGATGYNFLSIQPNGSVALPEGRAVIGGQIQRRTYAAGNAAVEIQSRNSVFLGLGSIDQGFPGVHQWLYVVNDPASGYTGLISTKDGSASYLPLAFHVGGAERMRIDPSGNVGIGTTAPSANATLDVVGGVKASRLALGTDVNLNTLFRIYGANGTNPASWPLLFITEDAPADFAAAMYSSALRVDHTGGAIGNRWAAAIWGESYGTTLTGGTNVGGVFSAGRNTNNYGLLVRAGPGGGVPPGPNDYAIYADSSAQSYFAGPIGIGTTSPFGKLEVADGLLRVSGRSNVARGIQVNLLPGSGDTGIWIGTYGDSVITSGASLTDFFEFRASPGVSSGASVGNLYGVYADPDGSFGSVTNVYGVYGSASGGTNNWAGYFNLGNVYIRGNLGVGTTAPASPIEAASGARLTVGGVWTNASSIQYKQDVASLPLDRAMETFAGLNPVTFRYKIAPEEQHVGFIAEEVPQLVATQDRKGLSPMDIVAVLVKVVQEQQRQIDALQAEIEMLKHTETKQGN